MQQKKTVFIVVGRGILVRNMLRNSFFKTLVKRTDMRVVVLFPEIFGAQPPEYLLKEFGADNVHLEFVQNKLFGPLRSRWYEMTLNLVFSPTRRLHILYGTPKVPAKSALVRYALTALFWPLSKLAFIKKAVRLFDYLAFRDRDYARYFETYKPDLVFSTALLSNTDVVFLKEARRRSIPTVAMPKSWDNLDKVLFKFEPDLFLVQNEHMKRDSVRYQGFHALRVKAVGFPQFDMYRDSAVVVSYKEYCEKRGFDPNLPTVFFGSEGLWSPGDEKHVASLYEARERGALAKCNILIRPHFSCIHNHDYGKFKGLKNVFVDDGFRRSSFFADCWDPSEQDMADFTNSLHHCSVMVTFASTLALDAVCFDKPVVTMWYGIREHNGEDWTHFMYKTGFYQDVLATDALECAHTPEELVNTVNNVLKYPQQRAPQRQTLRDKLCYKMDGKAGERIYNEIKQLMSV